MIQRKMHNFSAGKLCIFYTKKAPLYKGFSGTIGYF